MDKIRIGIIGTGTISNRHMTVWNKIPEAEVVAASDVDEKRLAAWGERYGVKNLYRDYKELLARDDIDAVDVCVHNNLHLPLSLAVMKAGKHCYCEKPMAGTWADAKRMMDAAKELGKKLAIQLSSIFSLQTRMAKEMVDAGELGKIYHMRSVGSRRLGRPGLDMGGGLSPMFFSAEYAGRGALFDMGVYHISQLLHVAGLPELDSVFGKTYQEIEINKAALKGNKFEVEELGVGLAKYKGGITLDILEPWAINMDEMGDSFVAGTKGGLKFINVDAYGGIMALDGPARMARMDPNNPMSSKLLFYGFKNNRLYNMDLLIPSNTRYDDNFLPEQRIFSDNHLHWIAYLKGEVTDATRINTPQIALDAMLVSEGLCLSGELGRSVTADEIKSMSKSTSMRKQKTDWGVLEYEL